jgi:hypothetical protein
VLSWETDLFLLSVSLVFDQLQVISCFIFIYVSNHIFSTVALFVRLFFIRKTTMQRPNLSLKKASEGAMTFVLGNSLQCWE